MLEDGKRECAGRWKTRGDGAEGQCGDALIILKDEAVLLKISGAPGGYVPPQWCAIETSY